MKSQSKLLHQSVLDMVAHLVLLPKLYHTCSTVIKPEYFKDDTDEDLEYGERPLRYIWLGLVHYYNEQPDVAPTKSLLTRYVLSALEQNCEDDPGLRDVLVAEDSSGYIRYIFDPDRKSFNITSGMPLVRRFLMERDVTSDFTSLANQLTTFSGTVSPQLKDELAELSARAEKINQLGVEVQPVPSMPDDDYFDLGSEPTLSTHLSFLDPGLGGGQRRGEVYGVIGATGAGKTTLGINILVGNSIENRAEVLDGGSPELCVYYTYEQSASQILPRLQSDACNIARSSLIPNPVTRRLDLSHDAVSRKEYERYLWPGSTETELDRWRSNKEWINQSTIVQNMSGVPDLSDITEEQKQAKRARGRGGIEEIANDLDTLVQRTGKKIRVVIIDYAGLVCLRQYGCAEEDHIYYRALNYMGDMCRKQIAGKFNCPVWLLHQMSGSANSLDPTVPLHHSQAAGCKSFGDNMDTCICLGSPDSGQPNGRNSGKCLYLTFSKTRNAPGCGFDAMHRILQHDDNFYRLNDVTEEFVPFRAKKCFMRKRGRFLSEE